MAAVTVVTVYFGGGTGPIQIPLPTGLTAPAYGMLNLSGNAVATSCPTMGTPVLITAGWKSQGPAAAGATLNTGNGSITVAASGVYEIEASLSLSAPNNAGDQWALFVAQNGLSNLLPGLVAIEKIDLTTDKVSLSLSGLASLSAGDALQLAISDATSNTANITITDGSFTVMLVAGR